MRMGLLQAAIVGIGVLAAASPAFAVIKTWNMNSAGCTTSGSSYGNTKTCDAGAGAPTVTASAWSNTLDANGQPDVKIQDAYLGVTYSGGLGVTNRDKTAGDGGEGFNPEHAMDNEQRLDSILFSFTSAVKLTQVSIGWMSGDSDISVLAYTGAGDPRFNGKLAGQKYSDLTTQGWKFINHYGNVGVGSVNVNNEPGNGVSSSYWLIGAYNTQVAAGVSGWNASSYDYVKLASVTGDPNGGGGGVPEPNALLLVTTAFLGAIGARRARARPSVR